MTDLCDVLAFLGVAFPVLLILLLLAAVLATDKMKQHDRPFGEEEEDED